MFDLLRILTNSYFVKYVLLVHLIFWEHYYQIENDSESENENENEEDVFYELEKVLNFRIQSGVSRCVF